MKRMVAGTTTPPGLAYFIYGILFLMVVAIGGNNDLELFSLSIFFVTNLFFTITLEKDIVSYLTEAGANITDVFHLISPFLISMSLLFEFISSILLLMTMNYLKKKFDGANVDDLEHKKEIELQTTIRENLDNTKIMFIFATISIALSAFGFFNKTTISLDSIFKLMGGDDKYMMDFIIGFCVFIVALASYILWKLNRVASHESSGKIPGMDSFVVDCRVLYSIAALYIGYIPFRIITRRLGLFNIGGLGLDWLIPALNVILLVIASIFFIKMGIDGVKVYENATSSFKQSIKDNFGVFVALIIILLCSLLMMPDWIINIFLKIVLPMMSVGITSYLLKRMFDMVTINNKIVVR